MHVVPSPGRPNRVGGNGTAKGLTFLYRWRRIETNYPTVPLIFLRSLVPTIGLRPAPKPGIGEDPVPDRKALQQSIPATSISVTGWAGRVQVRAIELGEAR